MQYQPLTSEEIEIASKTNIGILLLQLGEKISRKGKEYEWICMNQKINIRNNLWFNFYEQVGGDAISFVEHFYQKSFVDAVYFLLEKEIPLCNPIKEFTLPTPYDNNSRAYNYLQHVRKIDTNVIDEFIKHELLYESKKYHNVVFVGKDKNGIPMHAHKRSSAVRSNFKCNEIGSCPEYSFHWIGSDSNLFVFEAPIDLLSFISLYKKEWKVQNYAACCGVSDRVVFQTLKDYPHIKTIYLCLDNDHAGQDASQRIYQKLSIKGFKCKVLIPKNKDWNEDLIMLRKEEMLCTGPLV